MNEPTNMCKPSDNGISPEPGPKGGLENIVRVVKKNFGKVGVLIALVAIPLLPECYPPLPPVPPFELEGQQSVHELEGQQLVHRDQYSIGGNVYKFDK